MNIDFLATPKKIGTQLAIILVRTRFSLEASNGFSKIEAVDSKK
jgi:hypothetical protein